MNALTEVLPFLSFLLTLLLLWLRHRYSYWSRHNVPTIDPFPILGNLKDIILRKRNGSNHFTYLYNHSNAKDQPVVGLHLFLTPNLMIRDLDLIKQILVKDFHKFPSRFSSADQKRDGLGSNNLFMIKNPRWKDLRSKLTPFFTSGKSFIENARQLTSSFTIDVIASVAYGVQANSFTDPNGDFRQRGRKITTFHPRRAFAVALIFFFPTIVSLLRAKLFSRATSEFFRKTISFVMNEREKSGLVRNDLIDILVDFKRANYHEGNQDFLVAQAAVFFLAGFHTSASALTFTLYELAKNPKIQVRLRKEIKEALEKNHGKITYEMPNEMEYLGMVFDETLRMYPPLPYLDRQCVLPEGETEYSLKPFSDFAIPHGMPISIPFFAIQRDPKYFPDPLKYDPERFSPKNKGKIEPFSYMPFGNGPRSCIGERLAKIQSKIGLICILKNHQVTTCDDTQPEIILDKGAIITQEKGRVNIKFIRDPLIT